MAFVHAKNIIKTNASIDEKLDAIEKLPFLPKESIFEEWAIKSLTRVNSERLWAWYMTFLNSRKRKGKYHKALLNLIKNNSNADILPEAFENCILTLDQCFDVLAEENERLVNLLLPRLYKLISSANIKKVYDTLVQHLSLIVKHCTRDLLRKILQKSLYASDHITGITDVIVNPNSPVVAYQRIFVNFLKESINMDKAILTEEYFMVEDCPKKRLILIKFVMEHMDWSQENGFDTLMQTIQKFGMLSVGELRKDQLKFLKNTSEKMLVNEAFWKYLPVLIDLDGLLFEDKKEELWTCVLKSGLPALAVSWVQYCFKSGSLVAFTKDFVMYEEKLKLEASRLSGDFLFKYIECISLSSLTVLDKIREILESVPNSILYHWFSSKFNEQNKVLGKRVPSADLDVRSKRLKTMISKVQSTLCYQKFVSRKDQLLNLSLIELLSSAGLVCYDLVEHVLSSKRNLLPSLVHLITLSSVTSDEAERITHKLIETDLQNEQLSAEERFGLRNCVTLLQKRFAESYSLFSVSDLLTSRNLIFLSEVDLSYYSFILSTMNYSNIKFEELITNDCTDEQLIILCLIVKRRFKFLCETKKEKLVQQLLLKLDAMKNHFGSNRFIDKALLICFTQLSIVLPQLKEKLEIVWTELNSQMLEKVDEAILQNLFSVGVILSRENPAILSLVKAISFQNMTSRLPFELLSYKEELLDHVNADVFKKAKFLFILEEVSKTAELNSQEYAKVFEIIFKKIKFETWNEVMVVIKFLTKYITRVQSIKPEQLQFVLILHMEMIKCIADRKLNCFVFTGPAFVENFSKQLIIMVKSAYATSLLPAVMVVLGKFLKLLRVSGDSTQENLIGIQEVGESLIRIFNFLCSSTLRDITKIHAIILLKELLYPKVKGCVVPEKLAPFYSNCVFLILSCCKAKDLNIIAVNLDSYGQSVLQTYQERYLNERNLKSFK